MKVLNCIGKRVRFTVRKKTLYGTVRDCVHQRESTNKWLVLQKIDFSESSQKPPVRFRIGYYRITKGKLVWARNSPIFVKKDFQSLMHKAQARDGFFKS
jgi:hypothetical protein